MHLTLTEQIEAAAETAVVEAIRRPFLVADHLRAGRADVSAKRLADTKTVVHEVIDHNTPQDLSENARLHDLINDTFWQVETQVVENQRREGPRPTPGNPGAPERRHAFEVAMSRVVDEQGKSANKAAEYIADIAVTYWERERLEDDQFFRLWGKRSYITKSSTRDEKVQALKQQIRTSFSKNKRPPVR